MELTEIAKIVIELVVAVASAFFIPWLKAKTGAEQVSDMLRWVEIAVSAAEQLYDAKDGSTKKKYVAAFLEERGYRVNADELDAAIESAVLRLHSELNVAQPVSDASAIGF